MPWSKRSHLAMVVLALTVAITPGAASAATWQWGCVGPLGEGQLAFNRDALVIFSGKASIGKVDGIARTENLINPPGSASLSGRVVSSYTTDDANGGLEKSMAFTSPNGKLTLVEVGSKLNSRQSKLSAGCRDEEIERFTKTYRVERAGEAPATVTLSCMNYQLSTRGGRKCR